MNAIVTNVDGEKLTKKTEQFDKIQLMRPALEQEH
jgi:hypothetical protein